MNVHALYGKTLIKELVGTKFLQSGKALKCQYPGGVSARIDGVIKGVCAVEIESSINKQIRGALIDLLSHELSKKLLIIIPAHMSDSQKTVEHCQGILNAFKKTGDRICVVSLQGTGENHDKETDKAILRKALEELGILQPPLLEEYDKSLALTDVMASLATANYSTAFLEDIQEGLKTSTVYGVP